LAVDVFESTSGYAERRRRNTVSVSPSIVEPAPSSAISGNELAVLGSCRSSAASGADGAATGVAAAIRVGVSARGVVIGAGDDDMLAATCCRVMIFGGCVVTIVAVR